MPKHSIFVSMTLGSVKDTSEKIRSMEIRGAGKIARSAAKALKDYALSTQEITAEEYFEGLIGAGAELIAARPTAVSLPNAVRYVLNRVEGYHGDDARILKETTIIAAEQFIKNSEKALDRIASIGSKRIEDGDTVMTHCNSTAAIKVIKAAWDEGKKIRVVASEARPRYQGHITVRQLADHGIPTTLIVDSAVRAVMKKIDNVIVGADSIAANGAVINKIGTSQIALCANEARVRFLVAAETYKFHPDTLLGETVPIENRSVEEVADPLEFKGVDIWNPAFDVTPAEYIDLIITEKGVIPPQAAIMVIKEEFGWAVGEAW